MAQGDKRPRGRPEVPAKERRSVLLQFRVTEDEAARIKKQSDKERLKTSDWIRGKVID